MDEELADAACPALAAGGEEQVWQRNGFKAALELISVFAWAREKGQDSRNDSMAHWIRQKPGWAFSTLPGEGLYPFPGLPSICALSKGWNLTPAQKLGPSGSSDHLSCHEMESTFPIPVQSLHQPCPPHHPSSLGPFRAVHPLEQPGRAEESLVQVPFREGRD